MSSEFLESLQLGLTACALFLFAVLAVSLIVAALVPIVREQLGKLRKKDALTKVVAVSAFAVAIACGGSKAHYVPNAGADEGIALAHISAEYDSTNDVTNVRAEYLSGGVSTATPVSVRNDQTQAWLELTKIGATITTEDGTNVLAFAVSGNVATYRYWWMGTDTPAVIIESSGIEITYFAASSSSVEILWTCDEPNVAAFAIQRRRKGETTWETVGVTTSFAFVYVGFTIGETWEWRVSSTYTEGE